MIYLIAGWCFFILSWILYLLNYTCSLKKIYGWYICDLFTFSVYLIFFILVFLSYYLCIRKASIKNKILYFFIYSINFLFAFIVQYIIIWVLYKGTF
jgi:hypothetical protein